MRDFGSSSLSLAGSLLIAHPGLVDPNFHKTVLFISANDAEEGSFGLILNRPAGHTVAHLLPDREFGPLASVPVLLGGPVARDQLIFAAFRWHAETQRMECRHHIGVEEAGQICEKQQEIIRAFVGYAGWSKGQLEGELAQRAWMLKAPDAELLKPERAGKMWREMVAEFGPTFRLIAEAPDDLSRN